MPVTEGHAAWTPTGAGPHSGDDDSANWNLTQQGRVWVFNSPLTADQTINLTRNVNINAATSTDQITFFNNSGFDYSFQSDSATERLLRSQSGFRLMDAEEDYSVSIGASGAPITIQVDSILTSRFSIGRNATLYTQQITATPGYGSTYNGIAKSGEGTLVMSGSNRYVGATRLTQGTLELDFARSTNTADIIATDNTATAPRNLYLYGGTLRVNGRTDGVAVSQTLEKTELGTSSGHVNIDLKSTNGNISLSMGDFIRRHGSTVSFTMDPARSAVFYSSALTDSVKISNGVLVGQNSTNAAHVLAAFATVNGSTWATAAPISEGSSTMKIRGLEDAEYETSTNSTNWGTAATSKNVSLNGGNTEITAAASANTLRLQNGASLTISPSRTLSVYRGGILVTGTGPAGSISGGTLTSNTYLNELVVFQNNTTNAFTISSAFASAVSLTKAGAGKLIIDASPTGNINGGITTMAEGILEVSNINALGTGNLRFGGGTLRYVGDGGSFSNAINLTPGGGYLESSGTGGALVLSSTSTSAGSTTPYPSRLTLTGSNKADNTVAARFGINQNATLELVKEGTGTWVLSNTTSANLIDTTIREGTLKVMKLANWNLDSSIGRAGHYDVNGQGYSLVIDGGRLEYIGAGDSTDRLFTIGSNGATVAASGAGTLSFTNTGDVIFGAWGEARALTLAGSNTGDNTFATRITDNLTAQTSLTKADAGTWMITGNNTYTGATRITDGILKVSGNGTLGAANSALLIEGGTVDLGGKSVEKTNDVIIAGRLVNGSLYRSGGQIEVRSGEVSAELTGDGNLVKTTAGKATLSGYNAFDGDLEVQAGTLELANGFTAAYFGNTIVRSSGTLLVNYDGFDKGANIESGGTFGGHTALGYWDSGSDITLANGARLAPGSQMVSGGVTQVIGVLDTSAVTLNFTGGASLGIDLNSTDSGTAGVNWDQLVVGDVDLGSEFVFTLELVSRTADGSQGLIDGWDGTQDQVWSSVILFDALRTGEGNTPFDLSQFTINHGEFLGASGVFSVSFNGDYSGIDLHYTNIPEPGTAALLLGGLGGYLLLRRRQLRAKPEMQPKA